MGVSGTGVGRKGGGVGMVGVKGGDECGGKISTSAVSVVRGSGTVLVEAADSSLLLCVLVSVFEQSTGGLVGDVLLPVKPPLDSRSELESSGSSPMLMSRNIQVSKNP